MLMAERLELLQKLADAGKIAWEINRGVWQTEQTLTISDKELYAKLRGDLKRLETKVNNCTPQSDYVTIPVPTQPRPSRVMAQHDLNSDNDNDDDDEISCYISPQVIENSRLMSPKLLEIDGIKNVFCCIRPPGHHAGRFGSTRGCTQNGFCLLNNVAIGCYYSRIKCGLRKVAVIDIDAHFGNGTAEIMEGDSDAFYASIHMQTENLNNPFFPSSTCYTLGIDTDEPNRVFVNVYPQSKSNKLSYNPIRNRRRGREGFKDAFKNIVLPRLENFHPDIIFISSGFDGLVSDPVGGALGLLAEDYQHIAYEIQRIANELCEGRVISVLEGGYDLNGKTDGLAAACEAHIVGLSGI
jgi:acetoin utilization deacetylase AcuC-like enzyme